MPQKTILDLPDEEQAQVLRELRQARHGSLLGLHVLLLCATGRTPSEIADFLFRSRSSVYRSVAAYRSGQMGHRRGAASETDGAPKLRGWRRPLLALLKRSPQAHGWCRTRWSCQTLALQLAATRTSGASRETIRRTLRQLRYRRKRARHVARDDDPERVSKLARIRHPSETLPRNAALFFADELDLHLLPRLGHEWMLRGTHTEVMTPGTNRKSYLAGALNFVSGRMVSVVGGAEKPPALHRPAQAD